MRTSLLLAALLALGLASYGCTSHEPIPDGCAFERFDPIPLEDVTVRVEMGPTSSDADVFLDLDLADGTTASLFLDDSRDNFEANEVNEFDVPMPDPGVTRRDVRAMSLRVQEHLFASGPLDLDELTIWFDGTPMFHSRGPGVPLRDGDVLDTLCPGPL